MSRGWFLPSEDEVDFQVHGGVRAKTFFLVPQSADARAWVEEHLAEKVTMLGDSVAVVTVERRYLPDIIGGIRSAGLTMRWVDDPRGVQGIDYDVQIIKQFLR